MRNSHDCSLQHRRMADQRVLQVHRTNPLSARLDEVLGAVGDFHVALGSDGDHVTVPHPTVFVPSRAFCCKIVITGGDEWASDFEFARSLAIPRNFAVITDGADLSKRRGQSLSRAHFKSSVFWPIVHVGLQGTYRRDRCGFGHTPRLDYTHPELVEPPEKAFRSRRSRYDHA